MIITRKIKLIPQKLRNDDSGKVGQDTLKEIKYACYAQSVIMNCFMSTRYASLKIKDISFYKELVDDEFIKEITNSCIRVPKSEKSLMPDLYVPFGGYQTSSINKIVRSAFTKAKKDGLMNGDISLPTYRKDAPFYIASQNIKLEHEYENLEEFLNALYNNNKTLKLYLNYGSHGNPTLARFQVVLGSIKKSRELRNVIERTFTGEYKICGSSIGIEKNNIILNLSIDIPEINHELNQDIVMGVDLGIKNPAVCAFNTNDFMNEYVGDGDDFKKQRDGYKSRRRSLQKGLRLTSGGHGRDKKLKALDRLSHRERNWAKTFNHQMSNIIVQTALQHKAGTINIEDLSGIKNNTKKTKLLADWSYYQLQQQIEYKAARNGIQVKKINPRNTSITCSCCGNVDKEQRKTQAEFICSNPECVNYNKVINADFNAARNISMSTDYVDGKKKK